MVAATHAHALWQVLAADDAGRAIAYAAVRTAVSNGRQAFVICPQVESAATGSLSRLASKEGASARAHFERLCGAAETGDGAGRLLQGVPSALLYGQMAADEKTATLAQFVAGTWKVPIIRRGMHVL